MWLKAWLEKRLISFEQEGLLQQTAFWLEAQPWFFSWSSDCWPTRQILDLPASLWANSLSKSPFLYIHIPLVLFLWRTPNNTESGISSSNPAPQEFCSLFSSIFVTPILLQWESWFPESQYIRSFVLTHIHTNQPSRTLQKCQCHERKK